MIILRKSELKDKICFWSNKLFFKKIFLTLKNPAGTPTGSFFFTTKACLNFCSWLFLGGLRFGGLLFPVTPLFLHPYLQLLSLLGRHSIVTFLPIRLPMSSAMMAPSSTALSTTESREENLGEDQKTKCLPDADHRTIEEHRHQPVPQCLCYPSK